jgi:hypothetical protein
LAINSKQKWNSAHYVQVKVSIAPEIAIAFKSACFSAGKSMASVLSGFMAEYSLIAPDKSKTVDITSTRRKSRNYVNCMKRQLEEIREAEERCHDNIPENLRNSEAFEITENIILCLEEAICAVESVYSFSD